MKELNVPYSENLDFVPCAEAVIETFGWQCNDYTPHTVFRLCWNQSGLAVEAKSWETELRMEAEKDGGNVWHDSCMEFFFGPAEEAHRYINLEINPQGTIVMGFGGGRSEREKLEAGYKACLKLKTDILTDEGAWTARYIIPFSLFSQVFGLEESQLPVRELRVNFYKCGEMTKTPHYGMWSKVESENPDFHRPEFFGKLRLEE